MALFFDASWFDRQLSAQGKSRDGLAAHLGLSRLDIDMIFKDQRELTEAQVVALAEFVAQPIEDVVSRAGVATPQPSPQPATPPDPMAAINQRLTDMERQIAELKQLILESR